MYELGHQCNLHSPLNNATLGMMPSIPGSLEEHSYLHHSFHLRFHSWYLLFYRLRIKYMPLYFPILILSVLHSLIPPSPKPPANIHLFTVFVALSFPKCLKDGILHNISFPHRCYTQFIFFMTLDNLILHFFENDMYSFVYMKDTLAPFSF